MSDHPVPPRDLTAPAAGRLTALTARLTADLDRGAWTPGTLERLLTTRLLVATAGDGQFTRERVRETLEEGSMALLHAGGGRLARLLGEVWDLAAGPGADGEAALTAVTPLLERVAGTAGPAA
ncbi:hypothetical protein [Actinacidiphila rubida]|uniref:Uncharacterized protein n=1 Tax=Actinacidiphila rubida TaxID=310780 RepID=A0A1H8UXJ8_9ACTN|nr:hypothetical protein [Actinacidiphila rubida]SEP07876.1 hypothetical protein SAMN05216267_10914 [Actinacidiphila rubida]